MTATIVVKRSDSAPKSIEARGIVMVGSDPSCHIRLTGNGADRFALLIEARGSEHMIINQGSQPVQVGSQSLATKVKAAWSPDDKILLSDGTSLELIISRAPSAAPEKAPAAAVPQPPKAETPRRPKDATGPVLAPPDEPPPPSDAKRKLQFAVIGLCALAIVGMIVASAFTKKQEAKALNLPEILVKAAASERWKGMDVLAHVKDAERDFVQQKNDDALARFMRARDELYYLKPQAASWEPADKQVLNELLIFISQRIGQITDPMAANTKS